MTRLCLIVLGLTFAVPLSCVAWSKPLVNCSDPNIASLPPYLKTWLNCPAHKRFMKLRYLKNKNITCNDGSSAGFYIRRQPTSRRWLVFLEGGWYCHSEKDCMKRMHLSKTYSVMSSRKWPQKSLGDGILSPDRETNPNWWNVNHVYVPYCSSDVWTGNASTADTGGRFSFFGAIILEEVINELLQYGLPNADLLLLAGSSAGGTGVLLNLDRIGDKLEKLGATVKVRGLADSGWFLNTPASDTERQCSSISESCTSPRDIIKAGVKYWRSVIPSACAALKSSENEYLCYFGNEVYPTIKRPVFVFQWLYDTAQIMGDNRKFSLNPSIKTPLNYHEMGNYVMQLGSRLRQSLASSKVSAVFAPSCIAHTILTQKNWRDIKIKGTQIDDAIQSWLKNEDYNGGWRKRDLNLGSTKAARTLSSRLQNIWRKSYTLNLTDTCRYPTCNSQCPPPKNPMTGDKLDVSELAGITFNTETQVARKKNSKEFSGQKLKLIDRFYSDFNG